MFHMKYLKRGGNTMGKFGINYKIPEEWEQAYEDLSYAGQRSAVLYANGEDVYTWRIEEVELESPAVTL